MNRDRRMLVPGLKLGKTARAMGLADTTVNARSWICAGVSGQLSMSE